MLLPVTVKVLDTFLEAILWKPFQLFCHILNYISSITKAPSLQCWIQSREQVNTCFTWMKAVCFRNVNCIDDRIVKNHVNDISLYSLWRNLDWNWPVCWIIVMKEKPTVVSPIFGVFPSDHIPTATKDVNVRFFIHISNLCKWYQWILGTFWSYYG
jgi:hypothetical protein